MRPNPDRVDRFDRSPCAGLYLSYITCRLPKNWSLATLFKRGVDPKAEIWDFGSVV